jgi:phosphonate metabolism protein PhnN/1,5-bisphosphokinase (PRPP-forming)
MRLAPLILIVGPSGAGKDALIDGARQRLAASGRFHFAQRVVTRPATAGGEEHLSVTAEHFAEIQASGGFLLAWTAHGLCYGIPLAVEAFRREGVAVVANVSRTVVQTARRESAPVGVVVVTARPETLAARLGQRGRETAEDVKCRLHRASQPMPTGADVCTVANDAGLEDGIDRFVAALLGLLSRHSREGGNPCGGEILP